MIGIGIAINSPSVNNVKVSLQPTTIVWNDALTWNDSNNWTE